MDEGEEKKEVGDAPEAPEIAEVEARTDPVADKPKGAEEAAPEAATEGGEEKKEPGPPPVSSAAGFRAPVKSQVSSDAREKMAKLRDGGRRRATLASTEIDQEGLKSMGCPGNHELNRYQTLVFQGGRQTFGTELHHLTQSFQNCPVFRSSGFF